MSATSTGEDTSPDSAEADGSISSSPTKELVGDRIELPSRGHRDGGIAVAGGEQASSVPPPWSGRTDPGAGQKSRPGRDRAFAAPELPVGRWYGWTVPPLSAPAVGE